jgi:outer membrane lipoprotein-sorting protein
MRMILSLTLLIALLAPAATAADRSADRSMVYIEYRFIAVNIKPGSFEASVRKLWRYRDSYARLEEAPNPQTGVHGLLIANAPNSYLINRNTKVARHVVDPGPTYKVVIPVFPSEREGKLKGLQMGRELAFFQANGAVAVPDEPIDIAMCSVLRAKVEDSEIKLFLDKESKQPRQVSIRNPRSEYSIRYVRYRTDLPVDLSLFSVPKDVQVTRAN